MIYSKKIINTKDKLKGEKIYQKYLVYKDESSTVQWTKQKRGWRAVKLEATREHA